MREPIKHSRDPTAHFTRGDDGMTRHQDPYEPPVPDVAERDDVAGVDWLAWAMKRKLAAKRAEGYGGWNDPERCTVEHLARLFMDHLPKGDMVDIANFAMMLYRREGGAEALKAAASAYGAQGPDIVPTPAPPEPRNP